jgi:MIP family channel proteins
MNFKALLAELLGTFTLVFVGCAAVASGQGVVQAAFAHGLVVVGIAYTFGHISGAHLNPAVTLGLLVGGKVDVVKAVGYWVVQIVGGILAALVLSVILGSTTNLGPTVGSLTKPETMLGAMIFEGIMTFFLVSAVYQCAVFGKAGNMAGLAIGLTLAFSILAGGVYTGASLNPARTVGPALIMGNLSYVPQYLIAILAGGALAGFLHAYVIGDVKG